MIYYEGVKYQFQRRDFVKATFVDSKYTHATHNPEVRVITRAVCDEDVQCNGIAVLVPRGGGTADLLLCNMEAEL
jgi:hypothetical protein